MERQYHTYFDWDNRNANRFFSLFGRKFKEEALSDVRRNPSLEEGIESFVEIGDTRNTLIHQGVVDITLPKTSEEYHRLYKSALTFMNYVNLKFS